MERLASHNKVAGIKQTKAAIKSGEAIAVYVACDVDPSLIAEVVALCEKFSVELVAEPTRAELAKACKIDVPCAAAAALK